MNTFTSSLPLAAIIAALAGCGGSSPNIDLATRPKTSADTTTSIVSNADVSTISAGAAAAGVATDSGFAQLYLGGSTIAWMRLRSEDEALSDAVTVDAVQAQAVDGPGTPTAQSTVLVDASSLAAGNGQTASGSFTFISDKLAPDGSTLAPSWWHVQLSFSSQATPFTVTNDDGSVAQIDSGEMDLYIKDVTTISTITTRTGNWTRLADIYSVIPGNNPLHVTITPFGDVPRTSVISGIRHANQNITRTNTGTKVTRVDVHTVSGDASDLTSSIPSVVSLLGVNNGPRLNVLGGAMSSFTCWNHDVTLADKTVHSWVWDRWATFVITKTKTTGTVPWSSVVMSAESQTVYITRDGTQYGPYTRTDLQTRFNLTMDLTKAGESL